MTQDEKLDEALKQTFPASDPFSLTPEQSKPTLPRVPAHRDPPSTID
jgi:hypothetical protein